MLPSGLVSTYQQYKEDTNSIAAWLASTAKAVGFPADLLSPVSSKAGKPSSGGRLKGKARQKAKREAAASSTASPATPTQPAYIIDIKDFVPLAEHIAAKAASVPREFGETIDRVINARSGFGSKLQEHGQDLPDLSAAKHTYFVRGKNLHVPTKYPLRLPPVRRLNADEGAWALIRIWPIVLETVRKVLKPLMPINDAHQTSSETSEVSNRFAGLVVFEPSAEFLNAPDFERPTKTQNDENRYESEPMTSIEDAIFALTAIVNDMNRVRSRIQWIWSGYKTGLVDLAAAAIATNTAIDLVRNMMEDVLPLLQLHGGLESMLQKFHMMQCLQRGYNLDDMTLAWTDSCNDNFNYKTYEVASDTYLGAYRLLAGFAAVLQPTGIPLYKEGMYGQFDPSSDPSRKTGRQKFLDDRALLMPLFTDLMIVVRGFDNWLAKDEFIRGVEELDQTKQVPFYAVFAAQVFLDITYELGPNIERPFITMRNSMNFMDKDIESHFEFHAKLKIRIWPASNDAALRELQRHIHWIESDPVRAVHTRLLRSLNANTPEIKCHRLFRMSPVISGLMLYHFRARYHSVGTALANAWGSIQYCEHLYNALQRQELLRRRWFDMDVVYTNLGVESFFVGNENSKTLTDCFLKFCLQMGTSAAAMSARRRKNISLFSKAGPRGLKDDASPVQSMFEPRYVQQNGHFGLTPEHVNHIIELSLFEQEGSDEDGTLILGQIEDPEKLREKKKWQRQQKRQGSRNTTNEGCRMTVEHLIKQLVYVLHAETLEFSFPYMHMHRECWQVLRAVRKSCDAVLRELFTSAYMQRESDLPFVVGWILMAASGLDDGTVDLRPLHEAARALHGVLVAGTGSIILREDLGGKLGLPVKFVFEGGDEDDK